ncbi:P-loop containing nucleoside triphosphate hydrolase protein [Trichodelitschia bisporula]|uniref:P-loop containing nucleoside triphosphate hydrolase protein n=1 Tax=Trichodelitschia bisporula TaxID=703511 RepID=A0A6G1HK85_9PEZI|nr:P-loop containing nucleoside triphosphate hydrolase protein [Trichodelitschia bisporula]
MERIHIPAYTEGDNEGDNEGGVSATDDQSERSSILGEVFSVIDGQAFEDSEESQIQLKEDRAQFVLDYYEGPGDCTCCPNWVTTPPLTLKGDELENDKDDEPPIVVRRKEKTPGSNTWEPVMIEINSHKLRTALIELFRGWDNIIDGPKHLVFRKPFRPFFWRWEKFQAAIEEQTDAELAKQLNLLRLIVKPAISTALAAKRELADRGVITHNYIWILFQPGDLIYWHSDGTHRFGIVASIQEPFSILQCVSVGNNGNTIGYSSHDIPIYSFTGLTKITKLPVFPASYLENFATLKQEMVARGRKFCSFIGPHFKAYKEPQISKSRRTASKVAIPRRIMIDVPPTGARTYQHLNALEGGIALSTRLISQEPPPPPKHIDKTWPNGHPPGAVPPPPPPIQYPQLPVYPPAYELVPPLGLLSGVLLPPLGGGMAGLGPSSHGAVNQGSIPVSLQALTDDIFLLCGSELNGYCFKERDWKLFNVEHVEDIKWNAEPFEALVLPDGYKELVLAFVESQLTRGEEFGDVINGKGGGLVVLLAGGPGVGKTLTAESGKFPTRKFLLISFVNGMSVAEKIQKPLLKMELQDAQGPLEKAMSARSRPTVPSGHRRLKPRCHHEYYGHESCQCNHGPHPDSLPGDANSVRNIERDFEMAAQWGAVLLLDECDTYLQQRSGTNSEGPQSRIVATFLQKLEYYPSLLFLTTNRPEVLDSALTSRIHLTLKYPELDFQSRATIWKTFLKRAQPVADVSDAEINRLAQAALDGRKVSNVVKTARILASQTGRAVRYGDIEKVLRITEGLTIAPRTRALPMQSEERNDPLTPLFGRKPDFFGCADW